MQPLPHTPRLSGARAVSAAAYAKRTELANGWESRQAQIRRERRPLKELRDELIRAER